MEGEQIIYVPHIDFVLVDQRLKLGQLVVFDLSETTTGLDHDLGAHRNQKIRKNGLVLIPLLAHRISEIAI